VRRSRRRELDDDAVDMITSVDVARGAIDATATFRPRESRWRGLPRREVMRRHRPSECKRRASRVPPASPPFARSVLQRWIEPLAASWPRFQSSAPRGMQGPRWGTMGQCWRECPGAVREIAGGGVPAESQDHAPGQRSLAPGSDKYRTTGVRPGSVHLEWNATNLLRVVLVATIAERPPELGGRPNPW